MKILNVGNMLSGAEKTIDMRADCHCIIGSIGAVDKVDIVFDYQLESGKLGGGAEETIEGSASVTLYDFMVKYSMRPLVRDKGDALKYHEEKGMLYLELADFDISA